MMTNDRLQQSNISHLQLTARKKWFQKVRLCSQYAGSFLLLVACIGASCERHTRLAIEGGNPPKFLMTGNGILTSVRVRGPGKQREVSGEARFLYWVVEIKSGRQRVEELSPVTYGIVPDGFEQIYPEQGEAPSLVEGEHYYVRIVTSQANGDDGYFVIRDGKVSFAKYESGLMQR